MSMVLRQQESWVPFTDFCSRRLSHYTGDACDQAAWQQTLAGLGGAPSFIRISVLKTFMCSWITKAR
eukprot:667813-Karenia_brevis.AAC.1